ALPRHRRHLSPPTVAQQLPCCVSPTADASAVLHAAPADVAPMREWKSGFRLKISGELEGWRLLCGERIE
ncbi:hypothetical protein LINPERHAP1_LOCUS11496, partial [Linum perenne]